MRLSHLYDVLARTVAPAEQWTTLQDASRRGDLKAAAEAAHSLRGAAAVMGGTALARACADVEGAADAARPLLPAQLGRVAAEPARVTAALRAQGGS